MDKQACDACGEPQAGLTQLGRARLCRRCLEDVAAEIARGRKARPNTVPSAIGIARRIYRERVGVDKLIVQDVPSALMQSLRVRAATEGKTMRDCVIEAIDAYLK